jgi:hypothetical protein
MEVGEIDLFWEGWKEDRMGIFGGLKILFFAAEIRLDGNFDVIILVIKLDFMFYC